MQEKDYSDEHKHCTVQPFETAFGGTKCSFKWLHCAKFGGQGRPVNGAAAPWSLLRTALYVKQLLLSYICRFFVALYICSCWNSIGTFVNKYLCISPAVVILLRSIVLELQGSDAGPVA